MIRIRRTAGRVTLLEGKAPTTEWLSVRPAVLAWVLVWFLLLPPPDCKSDELKTGVGVPAFRTVLGNGLEVILMENHLSPLIASVAIVKAGSAYETAEISGVSHLLEHLLFNGTENRTQEELYSEMDFYGIYNNAHTDVEFTDYIVLTEKSFIDRALDIQADMLFRSTFPEEKLEKEKGVVLNEMAKDNANEDSYVDELFTRKLFAGTPRNLPAIGTARSVRRIGREEIVRYYKSYYSPDNMTVMAVGDFDTGQMLDLIRKHFGGISPSGQRPGSANLQVSPASVGKTYVSRMKTEMGYMAKGIPLTGLDSADLSHLDLFLRVADRGFRQSLNRELADRGQKEVFSADVGLNRSTRIPVVEIQVRFPGDSNWENVSAGVDAIVSRLPQLAPEEKNLRALKVFETVGEQQLWEKPHYFAMIEGGEIVVRGLDALSPVFGEGEISVQKCREVAGRVFQNAGSVTAVVLPGGETPDSMSEKIYPEYYSDPDYWKRVAPHPEETPRVWETPAQESATPAVSSLTPNPTPIPAPENRLQVETAPSATPRVPERKKIVLKNGLVLILDSHPDSKIFAVHLLARNRTRMEPTGKEGIVDLLHRLIGAGTRDKSPDRFQEEMVSIGAKIKTRDFDFIPFDDYSTTPEYSYIRFETLDTYAETGIRLFSEMVQTPRLDPADLEQARTDLLNLIRQRKANAKWVSETLFLSKLPFAPMVRSGVYGTEGSVSSITREDLVRFHELYFSPANLIVSVATSRPLSEVEREIVDRFEGWRGPTLPIPLPDGTRDFRPGERSVIALNTPQSFIRMGYPVETDAEEAIPLQIAGTLFSSEVRDRLVETLGIAYSFESGFARLFGGYYFSIGLGTRRESLDRAEQELLHLIDRFRETEVTQRDLDRIRNRTRLSVWMGALSRADQMYRLGLNEFLFGDPEYGNKSLEKMDRVSPDQIGQAIRKYFLRDRVATIIVE